MALLWDPHPNNLYQNLTYDLIMCQTVTLDLIIYQNMTPNSIMCRNMTLDPINTITITISRIMGNS